MDNLEQSKEIPNLTFAIKLQFPKFSKGYTAASFKPFIDEEVGEDNVLSVGRLSYPNEWAMRVKTNEIREKLITLGHTKISSRTCWIFPLSQTEVRGNIHWIPNNVSDESIQTHLEKFGQVKFIKASETNSFSKVDCDSRSFCMELKKGLTIDKVPYVLKIESHFGLITIKGRSPKCFNCGVVGHRKSQCQNPKKKHKSNHKTKSDNDAMHNKLKGMQYRPSLNQGVSVKSYNKKKKKKTVDFSLRTALEEGEKQSVGPPKQVMISEEAATKVPCSPDSDVAQLKHLLDELETLPTSEKSLKLDLIKKILTPSIDKKESNNQERTAEASCVAAAQNTEAFVDSVETTTKGKKKKKKKKNKTASAEEPSESNPP